MKNDKWKICSYCRPALAPSPISATHSCSQRNSKHHQSAFPLVRDDLQLASQTLRPRPHTQKSLPLAYLRWVEAWTIVFEPQCQPAPFDPQLNLRLSACGVTSDVVDSLLENQEDLAAHVGPDF